MKETPSGERVHIAFFGKRNAGKSSLLNAVTGQRMSLVSSEKGTTTDPVRKSMELLPIGPVVMIDTPGFDDAGELGEMRVQRTKEVLDETDLAVLVTDARDRTCPASFAADMRGEDELVSPSDRRSAEEAGAAVQAGINRSTNSAAGDTVESSDTDSWFDQSETELLELFREREIPYLIVWNKADLLETQDPEMRDLKAQHNTPQKSGVQNPGIWDSKKEPLGTKRTETSQGIEILVSAKTGYHIQELKETIGHMLPEGKVKPPLIRDLVSPGDYVLLVIPIDSSAPKGRLILPQQQVIRELLEYGAFPVLTEPEEIPAAVSGLQNPPALAVTDSQAFRKVSGLIPESIPLTSFSILFARYKGILWQAVRGTNALKELEEGDRILISEGCTHHRQCEDIGTVKLPKLIQKYTGHRVRFETTSGREFPRNPEELKSYRLILHCGGCMLNDREVKSRMRIAKEAGVPMTNYGTAIACMTGILDRSLKVFSV